MGYDEHRRFSAAAFSETGVSRVSADVRRSQNSCDFDHDAQDAGSVFAYGRNACASFELRHFLARDGRRRLTLRTVESGAAKLVHTGLWRWHGAHLR